MIATDCDGSLQFSTPNKFVNCIAHFCSLAIPKPAYSGGQSLKLHAISRKREPPVQRPVVREEFQRQIVGFSDIFSIAGQRDPAKRTFAFTKQRAYVFWNKSGYSKGVGATCVEREFANVVPVVECNRTGSL